MPQRTASPRARLSAAQREVLERLACGDSLSYRWSASGYCLTSGETERIIASLIVNNLRRGRYVALAGDGAQGYIITELGRAALGERR